MQTCYHTYRARPTTRIGIRSQGEYTAFHPERLNLGHLECSTAQISDSSTRRKLSLTRNLRPLCTSGSCQEDMALWSRKHGVDGRKEEMIIFVSACRWVDGVPVLTCLVCRTYRRLCKYRRRILLCRSGKGPVCSRDDFVLIKRCIRSNTSPRTSRDVKRSSSLCIHTTTEVSTFFAKI
jgi:hypothetical protein